MNHIRRFNENFIDKTKNRILNLFGNKKIKEHDLIEEIDIIKLRDYNEEHSFDKLNNQDKKIIKNFINFFNIKTIDQSEFGMIGSKWNKINKVEKIKTINILKYEDEWFVVKILTDKTLNNVSVLSDDDKYSNNLYCYIIDSINGFDQLKYYFKNKLDEIHKKV